MRLRVDHLHRRVLLTAKKEELKILVTKLEGIIAEFGTRKFYYVDLESDMALEIRDAEKK